MLSGFCGFCSQRPPTDPLIVTLTRADDVPFTGLGVVAELRELVAQRTGLADVVLVAVQR